MKKMKLIYVAGPYRNKCRYQLEKNVRIAEDMSFEVAKLGASYICPHSSARYFSGTLSDEFWIDLTLNQLARCDAMIVVDGWSGSSGTLGEIKYCKENNIPVFYGLKQLSDWLNDQ
jgi:nucleoside 2-deoxyribosyltransferase